MQVRSGLGETSKPAPARRYPDACRERVGRGEPGKGPFLGLPLSPFRLNLVSPPLMPVGEAPLVKTQLPLRKAEARPGEKGQKGTKEAPQAPAHRARCA